MGSGIGNMFGIDKIFGGLLDSIGLGALKPLVSMAFDPRFALAREFVRTLRIRSRLSAELHEFREKYGRRIFRIDERKQSFQSRAGWRKRRRLFS